MLMANGGEWGLNGLVNLGLPRLINKFISGFVTCERSLEGPFRSWLAQRFLGSQWVHMGTARSLLNNWLVVWKLKFIFPSIGNVIIPIDFPIFQTGRYTTKHITFQSCASSNIQNRVLGYDLSRQKWLLVKISDI